jgi:ribonuclease H / adenosylcobalamin/alpha-ribazole phosphatase
MSRPSGRDDPDSDSLWKALDAVPAAKPRAATEASRADQSDARRTPAAAGGLELIIRTDGAARGNPGPASLGAVLIDASSSHARRSDAPPVATISEYLGVQTNNVAEYTGVARALALAEELGASAVDMLLDSKLIVEQVNGRWKVKDSKLIPLHADVRVRLGRFARWSATHVPRAQNRQADALCNEAIDRAQAGGAGVVVVRPK